MTTRATRKLRAQQGDLRNLTHGAREQLHAWLRESSGTVPYKEIAQRLKEKFDLNISKTSLCVYRAEKYDDLFGEPTAPLSERSAIMSRSAIVIRIDVPAGCLVDVFTEERAIEERAS